MSLSAARCPTTIWSSTCETRAGRDGAIRGRVLRRKSAGASCTSGPVKVAHITPPACVHHEHACAADSVAEHAGVGDVSVAVRHGAYLDATLAPVTTMMASRHHLGRRHGTAVVPSVGEPVAPGQSRLDVDLARDGGGRTWNPTNSGQDGARRISVLLGIHPQWEHRHQLTSAPRCRSRRRGRPMWRSAPLPRRRRCRPGRAA
jgi:hypothetical protein